MPSNSSHHHEHGHSHDHPHSHEVEEGREPAASQAQPHENAVRFSVSLPSELARELDVMAGEKGYSNRSLAIADMVRGELIEHRARLGDQIAGTITLLFDHHKPRLQSLLTDLQHEHTDLIVSTLHVHLDHDNCLEVLVVRGDGSRIRALADSLIAAKGVKHGRLTVCATEKILPA